jgi:hypothetical protein
MAMSMIGRYITMLPEGTIFTTRDVLLFGMRSAVDKALSRFVLSLRIRRLARGVFVKESGYMKEYSVLEIATVKAESFGRKILKAPFEVTDPSMPGFGKPSSETTFYIDGHSSKFRIGDTTVVFKHSAPRKLKLTESKAGEAARALWYLGQKLADGYSFMHAQFGFNRDDRVVFRKNIRWMPAWISDQIKFRPWHKEYDRKLVYDEATGLQL